MPLALVLLLAYVGCAVIIGAIVAGLTASAAGGDRAMVSQLAEERALRKLEQTEQAELPELAEAV